MPGDFGPSTANPGSTGWANRLDQLQAIELSPRRAELVRLADGIRDVLEHLVQTSAPEHLISEAADLVEQVAQVLREHHGPSTYEGFSEAANAGQVFALVDHSPVMGKANPLAPPIMVRLDGDQIVGTATFGSAYEGPPGCVHGGYIAAAFDEVLGTAQSISGAPGMTGRLTIHYRSPTPLHDEVRFEGWMESVSGRKILTKGRLLHGDVLCAEAEALFISIDTARFAAMRAERDQHRS
jgi:acyl-coenzyme A thioesterase PaaI-like protein